MAIQGLVSVDGVKLRKINNLLYPTQMCHAGIWFFSLVKHEALHHRGFRSGNWHEEPHHLVPQFGDAPGSPPAGGSHPL